MNNVKGLGQMMEGNQGQEVSKNMKKQEHIKDLIREVVNNIDSARRYEQLKLDCLNNLSDDLWELAKSGNFDELEGLIRELDRVAGYQKNGMNLEFFSDQIADLQHAEDITQDLNWETEE